MWLTIIEMLLPLALQLITAYLKKGADKADARKAFLVFVEKMQASSGDSARLRTSYKNQLEELKKAENHEV